MPGLHLHWKGASTLGGSHLNDEQASDVGRHAIDGAVLLAIELERLGPDLPIGLGLDELDIGTFDAARPTIVVPTTTYLAPRSVRCGPGVMMPAHDRLSPTL